MATGDDVTGKLYYGKSNSFNECNGPQPELFINVLDGGCLYIIGDCNADGQVDSFITNRSGVTTSRGFKECENPDKAANPNVFSSESVRTLSQKAEQLILEAVRQHNLKRTDILLLDQSFSRSVGRQEWALVGESGGYYIQIIGNEDGILYLNLHDEVKDPFNVDSFSIRIFDSSARDNPFLKGMLTKVWNQIRSKGLHLQDLPADKDQYPLELERHTVKSLGDVEKKLAKETQEKEEGGTYYEGPKQKKFVRWPATNNARINPPLGISTDPEIVGSQKVVDVHTHPLQGGYTKTFSQMDVGYLIQRSFILDRFGFNGNYENHIVIPNVGTYILKPNLQLLRTDPDRFFRLIRLVNVDGIRMMTDSPKEFLKKIPANEAIEITFKNFYD